MTDAPASAASPRPARRSSQRAAKPRSAGISSRFVALVPVLVLSLAATGLAGCAARTPVEAPQIAVEPLPAPDAGPYRLRVGDLVAVKFWGNEELDDEQRIRPDGRISMPFVDEMQAAGLTPEQLDAKLTEAYASELARPNVTVIVREVAPPTVYVGGEVGAQGAIPWNDGMTLFRALQAAGGLLTTARPGEIVMIRAVGEDRAVARAVDIRPVMSGADPGLDVRLAANDVIFVPRTQIRSLNLFIQQYIDGVIPLQNILGGILLANIATEDDSSNNGGASTGTGGTQ